MDRRTPALFLARLDSQVLRLLATSSLCLLATCSGEDAARDVDGPARETPPADAPFDLDASVLLDDEGRSLSPEPASEEASSDVWPREATLAGDEPPSPPTGGEAGREAESSEPDGPDSSWDSPEAGPPSDAGEESAAADARGDGAVDCTQGDAGEPLDLRCSGLYSEWDSKTVSSEVRSYDPGLHLWSDGAQKTRWIFLPEGGVIDATNPNEWQFPAGTKLWKEFVLGGRRIETRMLWKRSAASSSWYRTTYRWASDESSALELTTGELDADGNGYEIPAQSACAECHGGRADGVLGFEAMSLASPGAKLSGYGAAPDDEASSPGSALDQLAAEGRILPVPSGPLVIPGTPKEAAALGYLHANCGTACHNSGHGAARFTGFWMRLDVAKLDRVESTDTWTTGWNQAADFSAPGAPSLLRLAACDPDASCVIYRMTHRDGVADAAVGTQMPPLATHRIDEQGADIVRAWLDETCNVDAGNGGDAGDGGPW